LNILDLKANQKAEITSIKNKRNPYVKIAEAMGLKLGETVRLYKKNGRNLIILMNGGRIIIDQDIAKEIEIQ